MVMKSPALYFYTTLSPVVLAAARLFSPFHRRLRSFFLLRRDGLKDLEKKSGALPVEPFRLWVHAASVGEFEQARPIIAALKAKHPDIAIFISFLSDSGYNARKNFADAAAVFYLPSDSRANASKLLSLLKPDLLLLMRYDFWPNHLLEAKKQGTTLVLAAAVLQEGSPYFKPLLKGFYRSIFHLFNKIYTVSASDSRAFRDLFDCQQAERAGDPRFDQVSLRSQNTAKISHLRPFFENRTVLVAGSVWDRDEMLLLPAWQGLERPPALILVPHEVNPANMERLYNNLQSRSIPFTQVSKLNGNFNPEREILVIDQSGYLAELYSLASIAYVGGGFGVNVHNTLEPAVYGIPVLFGPRHHNSPEAEELARRGGARVVYDQTTLGATLKTLLKNSREREECGRIAGAFVREMSGATAVIAGYIEQQMARD